MSSQETRWTEQAIMITNVVISVALIIAGILLARCGHTYLGYGTMIFAFVVFGFIYAMEVVRCTKEQKLSWWPCMGAVWKS